MKPPSPKLFLTAEWRCLAMLNYEMDPAALTPFVPAGTELDFWNGRTYVSLVGFLFQNARVRGFSIPFHRHFEEVNLRFYVRHKADDGWRRGVVFIKELVPRRAIAFIARTFYNENYIGLPMSHRIENVGDENSGKESQIESRNQISSRPTFQAVGGQFSLSQREGRGEISPKDSRIEPLQPQTSQVVGNQRSHFEVPGEGELKKLTNIPPLQGDVMVQEKSKSVLYSWRFKKHENFLKVTTRGAAQTPSESSQQEFITEHYWGYVRQRDGSTMEYLVEHPRWRIWETEKAEFHCDIAALYGKNFCEFFNRPPASAFLADGSQIRLYTGVKLRHE